MTKNLSCFLRSKLSELSDPNLKKKDRLKTSFKELTEQEKKGLAHSLKFAIVPNKISPVEIVASVEEEIFT